MKKYIQVIEKCSLFSGISREEILEMSGCLKITVVKVAKNQTIIAEGDPVKYMGVVLSGSVRVIREDYYGNRTIVAEMGPAELFAETAAAAGAVKMPVSVTASQDSEIMLMDCRKAIYSCCNGCIFHNRLIANLLQAVAEKNMLLNQKMEIISKRTTREKLMAYLLYEAKKKNSGEFVIPYSRQELADYLGVDRSAMSAEIARMRKDGLIESKKSRFKLLEHL